MRHIALWLLIALGGTALARAAVVQGVVLDEETGYPLARSQVNMLPIAGTGGAAVSLRSGDRGAFTILSVRAGWYVLRVTRVGYAAAEAGQMRPGRPGTPFEVTTDDRSSFFQIRMRRLPAITGSVLDENSIGIADFAVHLYTARRPVRRVAETKTDDRGNFRIGALEPGSYIARSGAAVLEDDYSLVPTYYKYGTAVESAEPVRVRLGETQPDIVIHPVRGRLLSISGVFSVPADGSGRLVLVTDTGRRVIATAWGPDNTTVPFQASGIAPGAIELIADGGEGCGGYLRRILDRDTEGIRLSCANLQRSRVDWRLETSRSQAQYPLAVRRVDLDGVSPVTALKDGGKLAPGHWEVMAQTGGSHYVKSITGSYGSQIAGGDDGWYGVDVGSNPFLYIQLSAKPAAISGTVTTAGRAVTGAVVYLEAYDAEKNQRIQLWSTRTDLQGGYSFAGLKPGRYHVLSSFDFDPDDRFAMERAVEVTLREGDQASQPVEMVLP